MDPAFLCASELFGDDEPSGHEEDSGFTEREHQFPGLVLTVREFMFHPVNANLLWPGSCIFAQWLQDHKELLQGRRILELGSGTGALAIYLKKALDADITTSDYHDDEVEANIAYNCEINGITPPIPHIKHTWGEELSIASPSWDLIIASDILLYVKQYGNLIGTLELLLGEAGRDNEIPEVSRQAVTLPQPCFLMSWRRRIPKEDEMLFFKGCTDAGLQVKDLGARVYCINRDST